MDKEQIIDELTQYIENRIQYEVDRLVNIKEEELKDKYRPKNIWKKRFLILLGIIILSISLYFNYKKGLTINDINNEINRIVNLNN